MGLKSSALLLVAGAAIVTYAIPESRHEVTSRIDRTINTIEGLLKECTSNSSPDKSPLRPLQQPYLFSSEQPSIKRPDGTQMQPWNYRGNSWPKEWPIMNEDGSYNRDYINWYQRKAG